MATTSKREHEHSVDIVKGLCIIFVIINHYSWQDSERLKFLFPFWIHMAVPAFMVISGYVYTKSFHNNHLNSIGDAYTINNILRRILKYSIPFIIAFAVEEIIFTFSGNINHNIAQIGRSFLNGGHGPGGYYYPILIQFIFYFPIIFVIIQKYDFKGVVICGLINFIYELLKRSYGMNAECYRLLLFRYTLLIAFGCYLAMGKYKRHRLLSVICFFTGGTYIFLTQYIGIVPPITNFWTGTSMWAALFLISFSPSLIINKIKNRPIEILGKASYEIFLIQMVYYSYPVFYVYKFMTSRALQVLITITLCVFVGIVFYYFVTPLTNRISITAQNLMNKFTKKYLCL